MKNLNRPKATLINYRTKTKRLLTKIEREPDTSSQQHNDPDSNASQRKYRLPEIELKRFGGELSDWLGFWGQFKKIDEDNDIVPEDKYQYLLQATVRNSRAREIIESFPPTANNYRKAVDHLKSRFGKEDTLIEVYVRDLLRLVLNNALNLKHKMNLSVLYDKLETQLRALETLGVTTEKYAAMLYPLVESCLPEDVLRAWERNRGLAAAAIASCDSDTPDSRGDQVQSNRLTLLMTFLRTEVDGEERITLARSGFGLEQENRRRIQKKIIPEEEIDIATASELFSGTRDLERNKRERRCVFCEKQHASQDCRKATGMTLEAKRKIIMQKGCCFVCLKNGHRANECKAKHKCNICEKRHFSVMCPNLTVRQDVVASRQTESNSQCSKDNVLSNQTCSSKVILQTLLVRLRGNGREHVVRALLDTGSQKSYITEKIVTMMDYKSQGEEKVVHSLFGGMESGQQNHKRYKAYLTSMNRNYMCNFDVLDQPKICGNIPKIQKGSWMKELHEQGIVLSDVDRLVRAASTEIDLLIGADVIGKLLTGRIRPLRCGPVAVETYLGWTMMGKLPTNQSMNDNSTLLVTSLLVGNANIAELWKLDVLGISDPAENKTKEELQIAAMDHFLHTVDRNLEGRYEVSLPWVEGHPPLPSNRQLAERRLQVVRKKMLTEGTLEAYQKVFNNWLTEEIIEEVPCEQVDCFGHYMPHRPVVKESSETTKIRPVFDASAHEKGYPSLNDCLEKGPNLIELMPSVLNRFRRGRFGVTSDIEKAFLQISLRKRDRDFLRFLWYDQSDECLKIYRHRRVVFGVTSSPFLLSATLAYHLSNAPEHFLKTAEILKDSFYVDNCVTSLDTEEEVYRFVLEAKTLLSAAQFNLRDWRCNNFVKETDGQDKVMNESISVLGLIWNVRNDTLSCDLHGLRDINIKMVTKRKILSVAHQVFDPIGFSCPATLVPKLLLQEIWQLKVTWDEELPQHIVKQFMCWSEQLHLLSLITIPRWLRLDQNTKHVSLHVFCDASKRAYAACLFLRVETEQTVTVQLVQAKARVAPLKPVTIPRLELLACCIASRLTETFKKDMRMQNLQTYYWSDSMNALCWIRRNEQWGTFVWNRVHEIRSLTDPKDWRHISGAMNPADLPSRGCNVKQLLELRWWEGPTWLRQTEKDWPKEEAQPDEETVKAERRKTVISVHNASIQPDWYYRRFSSYLKIVRMISWIFRFCNNSKKTDVKNKTGELSLAEIDHAEIVLIKMIQREAFQGDTVDALRSLRPIVDIHGVIRSKTNIIFRDDTEDFKYPMLLPANHPVVMLLILWRHRELCHAGVSTLMTDLRERFWIMKCRSTVRRAIRQCGRCLRFQTRKVEVMPAPLPENQVRDAAVFEITGVDLAGPLFLKGGQKA